jgi:filamentous hemagglutinin family protein
VLSFHDAHSDVTTDGSLGGPPGRLVQPGNGFTYDIKADFGQQTGSNLFHSFGRFNIDPDQHANFSGPPGISNIVSRITGGESAIAGRITSTIGGASLYLVNPAGFVLTNGAVVDVGGSFYLSTVDFIEFGDGARFFSSLSANSSLSTEPIRDFGFLQGSRGSIAIDSSRATPGEDRSAGNNLNVNAEFISLRDADLLAQEIGVRMGDATFGQITVDNTVLES